MWPAAAQFPAAPAAAPTPDLTFYLDQARQNSPRTRDNGRTVLRYSAENSTNYIGYDGALSNGALYQGYAQVTKPLFNQKRFEAYAQQAQRLALSQQNLSQRSLHDLEKEHQAAGKPAGGRAGGR